MLEKSQFEQNTPQAKVSNNGHSVQERSILDTFPLITRIVKKGLTYSHQAVEDISQKVLFNLWRWHSKDTERNLSEDEWKKIAVRAAQNEVKQYYRSNNKQINSTSYLEELPNQITDFTSQIEGNTNKEINSLAKICWEEILQLSLRQKYSLLLQKQELIFYLVSSKCCQIAEIAEHLQLSKARFLEIYQILPIPDEQISEIFYEVTSEKLTTKQVWEARSKARTKLAKLLK
ncbi:MAG: hypothetical protein MUC29_08070 [Pyrinomonadaceae bacterium]|jgi:DNA-directed RNA polymerase specialized sigma24 family protein|nr:hypothetical protein [Pyrinomonadaceae bacterium]